MVKKLTGERKYKVTVAVTRLEGLPMAEATTTVAAVELRWNRPNAASTRGALLSCFVGSWGRRRRRRSRCVSPARPVGNDGAVEWGDGEANRFETLWCSRSSEEVGNEAVTGADSRFSWDVSFSVLIGTQKEGKLNESKLEEMGSTMVSLGEWARASQPIGNEPLLQTHTKRVPIALVDKGCVTLHVAVTFMEVTSCEETKEAPSLPEEQMLNEKESSQVEKMTNIRAAKSSRYFSSETPNLDQLLRLANAEDKLAVYGTRNQSGNSSCSCGSTSSSSRTSKNSDTISCLSSASVGKFLSSTRKLKLENISEGLREKESMTNHVSTPPYSLLNEERDTVNRLSGSDLEDDPIGSWKTKEFISRDKRTKLKTPIFCASIDQRDETAGGESACTALVAVFANSLHRNQLNALTKSKFDALIREGSLEWRKLCKNAYYKERFPNKHFDLDTILEAKIRPILVVPEKSFVGFFHPESFEFLRGAMSFDGIWDEISGGKHGEPMVYIVSWNDHFFVLKVEENAYYIVDTLGERLFEGCNRAYILRFDDTTEMYKLPLNGEKQETDEVISRGKKCCGEFISRFLASVTLREELEMERKGEGNDNASRHRRLQIEFHYTILREGEASDRREQLDESSELNAKFLDLDQVEIFDTSSESGAKIWNLDQLLRIADQQEKVAFYGHRERAKGRTAYGVERRVDYL